MTKEKETEKTGTGLNPVQKYVILCLNNIWIFFFIQAMFWAMSSFLYTIEQNDLWFSRSCLSLLCMAVCGLLWNTKRK
jgi:hypothetical protein